MDIKQHIQIVEAFGQDEKGEMDTKLYKEYPKSFREKIDAPLTIAVYLASVVAGAKLGVDWVIDAAKYPPPDILKFLGAVAGGGVGMFAGIIPAGITTALIGTSDVEKQRNTKRDEEIESFISKNPNVVKDVEIFVNNLINQTPRAILQNIKYLKHISLSGKNPTSTYVDTSITGRSYNKNLEFEVKNLAQLISRYFDQQDAKWETLAKKYNIDSPTLYLIYKYKHNLPIGWKWEFGVKELVSAPSNQEPIEEASDEAIARIVELSKK